MSDRSKIEWTDSTWNPVRGCVKISPGCKHCYAEAFAERFRGVPGHPYEQGFDLRLIPEKLSEPFRWSTPRMVFVNSMSDLFQDAIPDEFTVHVAWVMVPKRRISCWVVPAASRRRTQAVILFLCTSNPQQRAYMMRILPSLHASKAERPVSVDSPSRAHHYQRRRQFVVPAGVPVTLVRGLMQRQNPSTSLLLTTRP